MVLLYCFTGLFKTGPVLDKCMTPDLAEMVIFIPGRAVLLKSGKMCFIVTNGVLCLPCKLDFSVATFHL